MKKRLAVVLTALTLLVATAFALNGGVISIVNGAGGSGTTGQLQCVYQAGSQSHTTKWKIRRVGQGYGGERFVGVAPISISVGAGSAAYEIQFIPQIPGDVFTGANPVLVTISCNQLTTVTVRYQ